MQVLKQIFFSRTDEYVKRATSVIIKFVERFEKKKKRSSFSLKIIVDLRNTVLTVLSFVPKNPTN